MKLFIVFLFISSSMMMLSCQKKDIMQYEGGQHVQFTRSFTDSSLFSFLALPDVDEASVPLSVDLIGNPQDRDRQYKISLVPELSTVTAANYSLPSSFVFRANRINDTAWVVLKKTPELSERPLKMVFRIEATEDLKIGQTNYAANILYVSNVVARPNWWNGTVEGIYLGAYSDKKFLLFIEITGKSELDPANSAELRYHAIQLKNYLLREKDQGRTVYEEDGSEMTVSLIGG